MMAFFRNTFGPEDPLKKVHLFEHDANKMASLVLLHPAKETGGNLFGLWTDNDEPVLHIVLGPAIGCTRTEVSFYQSIPYLERVGGLVTRDYQLCHIGEWHSHHRLRLSEPSSGDSSTIIRNFPRGTCGFLLIIANILPSSGKVTLSPYLYREGQRNYERRIINLLHGQSPFARLDPIFSHMLQDEDDSSTVQEYLQREHNRSETSIIPTHVSKGNEACTYIFEEDYRMIEGLLLESGGIEIRSEGDLFGLWTTDEQPVLHSLHKPLDKPNEQQSCEPASSTQPQNAVEISGEENLANDEYPGIHKIGKYILRGPMAEGQHKPTAEEEDNFRKQFSLRWVLVVACIDPNDRAKSVIASYVYSDNISSSKPLKIKVLRAAKVFRQRQKASEEVNLMDVDPPRPNSPSPQNIWKH